MTHRVLIAMTSHDEKGDTGESTGAYLGEIAHPYEVFTHSGYKIEFASVRGGRSLWTAWTTPTPLAKRFWPHMGESWPTPRPPTASTRRAST